MKKLLLVLLVVLSISGYSQTVTDIDGNVYKTVVIGYQEWMAENLKVTKYNDGDEIFYSFESFQWRHLNKGAWCYYNNDSTKNNIYGKLYNQHTFKSNKLCPIGWNVPTKDDWNNLYLPKDSSVWGVLLGGGHNEIGTGVFRYFGQKGFWWSSTVMSGNHYRGHGVSLSKNKTDSLEHNTYTRNGGLSVRCVREAMITNTEEISDEELVIYPNPFTDVINVNLSTGTYIIINLEGAIVKKGKITPQIDINQLASGSYFLKININNEIKITKIIKK